MSRAEILTYRADKIYFEEKQTIDDQPPRGRVRSSARKINSKGVNDDDVSEQRDHADDSPRPSSISVLWAAPP